MYRERKVSCNKKGTKKAAEKSVLKLQWSEACTLAQAPRKPTSLSN